jgi:hypothetical protein
MPPVTAIPLTCIDKAFLFYSVVYEASPFMSNILKPYMRYRLRNERKYLTANSDEVEKCQALFQNDSFETTEINSCAQGLYEYLTTATSVTSYRSKFVGM